MDTKYDEASFKKMWGFTRDDLWGGKVKYGLNEWFRDLERAAETLLSQEAFQDASEEEQARLKCLGYMACCAYATRTKPRDLSEKTFPHFQSAILGLQEDFEPFGIMLDALQEKNIRDGMAAGKNKEDAIKQSSELMRSAYERSSIPRAARVAQMEIDWE